VADGSVLTASDPVAFSYHHEEPYPFVFVHHALAQSMSARRDSVE
jgi:hypothetical protein